VTDIPGGEADAAAIHAAFAETVRYTGGGLTAASISAVRSDVPADAFSGPGATARQVSFEVLQADLTADPANGDTLVDGDGEGATWTVVDVTRRDDVASWSLIVEEAEQ
jgi:hypothetical protein